MTDKNSEDRVYYRLGTHLEMLRDRVRCLAYQKAIGSLMRGKTVLDVGCGSGILSFFAARAGAAQVLAVDTDVPPGAEEAARANGLADHVRFFRGRIQDIKLPLDAVDVIVSEWMGGLLLMEDMLPAVLHARDRWLKPGGIMLPDRARLFLAPLDNVAGLDSKRFPTVRETIAAQMWVSTIDPQRFLAEPSCILDLDLYAVPKDFKTYEAPFRFDIKKTGILNGFGLWFDVLFSGTGRQETRETQEAPVLLSTAPWLPPTHWGQGLWILPFDIDVSTGHEVSGTFNQTKISPSTASFRTDVVVGGGRAGGGVKKSFRREIEASPSTMNSPGGSDEEIAAQAVSGAYRGQDCLWIGCSMSFGALAAARNGAKSVSIRNHSLWAARAMRRLAEQEALTNVRFLDEVPPPAQLQNKYNCILGSADASWQALVSHIKVRRTHGRACFRLQPDWRESPWKQFYGFDFSAYAPYDLGMYHEDQPLVAGFKLIDITGLPGSPAAGRHDEDIIYAGIVEPVNPDRAHAAVNLADGAYNCARIDFDCGTVVLPLPGGLRIDASKDEQLRKAELTISVCSEAICRFRILLSGPGVSLRHCCEQPLTSMGHIVRGQ